MKFSWGYDISPLIHEGLAVFPGDQSFRRQVSLDFQQGDHLTLSSIQTTLHLGAHADSPVHYHKDGLSIDHRDPEVYLGWCEVLRLKDKLPPGSRVGREQFKDFKPRTTRLLVDTGSFNDPDHWREDSLSFEPSWLQSMAEHGVRLIGIDTPSVDPASSKTLESHQVLFKKDMAVLEGLLLSGVPEDRYLLSALPLKIQGADASPVRAVLFTKEHVNSWLKEF